MSFAYHLLQEVNVDVQNEGWVWNREEHYELLPNSLGKIVIPENVLRMDVSMGQIWRMTDVVRRNGVLYDKLNHTDVFPNNGILMDITWKWPYEDLPSVFKRYITLRASGRAATQMVANPELVQLLHNKRHRLEQLVWSTNAIKVITPSLVRLLTPAISPINPGELLHDDECFTTCS